MKYFTWLDIERVIRQHTCNQTVFPEGINKVTCFSDGIEVLVSSISSRNTVTDMLKSWFGDWLRDNPLGVLLDIGDVVLPIAVVVEEPGTTASTMNRPLWQDLAYVTKVECQKVDSFPAVPTTLPSRPTITAFHSFKGGVGRTTSLTTFVTAIIESSRKKKAKKRILIIDADLEAPGITYWFKPSMLPDVSFITFLEVMHYPPASIADSINVFSTELKRTSLSYSDVEVFFLPAAHSEAQLLDTPVLPEELTRSGRYPWLCTEYIHKLGSALDTDHVLVDLRAGLSEISSPLLFDPRVERMFVTTVAEQSVRGTSFILSKISDFNTSNSWTKKFEERKPNVILNFLTKEVRSSSIYDSAITQLESAYMDDEAEDPLYGGLSLYESSFAQTLMSFSNWEDAIDKLKASELMPLCLEWIDDNASRIGADIVITVERGQQPEEDVRRLATICDKYEYAEKGESENLLVTEPIRNLAKHFFDKLPSVVSIGAKGAGKTFNFLQLSSFTTWNNFVKIVHTAPFDAVNANIYPLLQSANLEEKALSITERARKEFYSALGMEPYFSPSDLRAEVEDAVSKGSLTSELDWSKFWINQMSRACCLPMNDRIEILNEYLLSKGNKVVFLFDGIEDTFRDISIKEREQQAVSALLDIPNKILELRTRALGTVIFLREDYLKAVLKQNVGQFLSRYNPYQLTWDADSFLKLVYWVCVEAGVIEAKKEDLDLFSRVDVLTGLERLWGRKLGGEKEANTASWVYAALTDLKGRLQARDVIRLLRYASERSMSLPSKSRETLLSPQAIRNALVPCSLNKVEEAKQEYLVFRRWVEALTKVDPVYKKIPFDPATVALDSANLETLKDIGVVFEDKDREEKARFYIPEIYRSGLGFRLDKGARPRVLVLQKRAIGNNLM